MKKIIGICLVLLMPVVGTFMTDAPLIWPISVLVYNVGLLYGFVSIPAGVMKIIAYGILATILYITESAFFFSYYLQNDGFNEAFFITSGPICFMQASWRTSRYCWG